MPTTITARRDIRRTIASAQLNLEDVREAMIDPALVSRIGAVIEELDAISDRVEPLAAVTT